MDFFTPDFPNAPAPAPIAPPSNAAFNGDLSSAFLVGSNASPAPAPIAAPAALDAIDPVYPLIPAFLIAVAPKVPPATPPSVAQSNSLIISFSDL